MKLKVSYLLTFLLLFLTTTLSFANQQLTFSDSSQVITIIPPMKGFIISLPANPTTGYQWTVKQYDSTMLTLDKQDYLRSTSQLVGAGGHARLYFSVNPVVLNTKQEKTTSVILLYARSFAPNDNPKEVKFNITIEPAK